MLVVEGELEQLTGLEVQDAPLGDGDRIAGLRVSALALAFVAQHEVAEARDLDLLPAPERLLHRLEDEVDQIRRLLLREAAEPTVNGLHDVRLRHRERRQTILPLHAVVSMGTLEPQQDGQKPADQAAFATPGTSAG